MLNACISCARPDSKPLEENLCEMCRKMLADNYEMVVGPTAGEARKALAERHERLADCKNWF